MAIQVAVYIPALPGYGPSRNVLRDDHHHYPETDPRMRGGEGCWDGLNRASP